MLSARQCPLKWRRGRAVLQITFWRPNNWLVGWRRRSAWFQTSIRERRVLRTLLRGPDLMTNWRCQWLRAFLGLSFCWSLQAAGPAACTLQAQENAPAVAEPLPPAIRHSMNVVLPEPAPVRATADAQDPAQITAPVPGTTRREVTWRRLPAIVLHDQKDLWLFPVHLAHGRHWLPAAAVVGVTAGLLTLDAHDAPYFRRTNSFSGFNSGFSGPITAMEIALVPAAIYGIGLVRKDSYAQETALLSGEAVFDSGILAIVMKDVSRRRRPSDIAPRGDFSDTFFRSPATIIGKGSAFPSGHAILAFSVATVIARRTGRNHRWVPWVAYATAAAIGFSRITLQSHFPSDVFLGAALGYSVARFDVLRNR
jgi:membrane-associated phospholipid phosphatase